MFISKEYVQSLETTNKALTEKVQDLENEVNTLSIQNNDLERSLAYREDKIEQLTAEKEKLIKDKRDQAARLSYLGSIRPRIKFEKMEAKIKSLTEENRRLKKEAKDNNKPKPSNRTYNRSDWLPEPTIKNIVAAVRDQFDSYEF